MKKIIFVLTTLLLTFASCSMDVVPEGEIIDEEALSNVKDCESFTNGLYAMMRSVTSGDYVVLSDIQLDDFHAVIGNGNRRMLFYNGSFTPATGEIASYYAGFYSLIAQTNFFIERAEPILSTETSEEKKAVIKKCIATAHFLRAFCYNSLADKFCESYKNASDIDAKGKGLSIQLKYAPTADNSKYPGRSSLRDTYAQILSDLNKALDLMTSAENTLNTKIESNSNYVNTNTIKALMARVALNMGNDADAFKMAEEVIKTNKYQLTERSAYKSLWYEDKGSEVILQIHSDYSHHGSSTGVAFASNNTNSDYVPTNDCIELFDENDIRWTVWFDEVQVSNSGGTAQMFRFLKYPGNQELYLASSGSNFINKAKPFRSAELYLIAAEAAFNMNQEADANKYLTQLMSARINRYASRNLSGAVLLEAIQDERHRELMGEGFRLADLKRWNIGFTRGDVWDGSDNVIVNNFKNQHYDANDYRLTWPIPQHEIDSNPQVEQNPGY